MTFRRDLGDFGERVAAAHLESKGYRILARNFRCREGEVDLIAQLDATVAFVEVKTRRGVSMGTAAESISTGKARRLLLAAQTFALQHDGLSQDRRIDVIAIDLDGGRVLGVHHFEGAVEDD
jgi:putative endonuclease